MKPLNTGNDEFIEYKELAKSFIKSNDYKKAQEMYELALKNFELSDENKFLIINNISLCNFKLENYLETIKYATEVLEYDQGNEKARYRRCVCYNYVKKIKEALIDVKFLINLNPKSMLYIQLFNETSKNATDKVNDHFSVDVRIDKIYKQVFDNENKSHVVNGLKKIIGLITDENRTKTAVSKNLLNKLFELYSSKWVSSDFEIKTWIMKIYVIISNINKNYSLKIYRMLDLCILKTSICEKHETKNYETFCTIVGNLLSSFVFMACGIKNLMDQREQYNLESLKKQESGEYRSNFGDIMDKIDEKESLRLIQIYTFLIDNVDSKKISIFGRLAILRTLLTFLKKDTSCGWSIKLIKIDEMNKLLGLCSVVNNISILSTNENIKNTLSAIFTKISDDVQSKKHSEIFKDSITEYLQFSMQNYNDFNSKLELLSCLGVLFNGPRKQILSFISCIPIFDLINNVLETANNDFIKYTLNILIIVISKNISNDNSAKLVRKLNDICENVAMSDSIRILSLLALCKLGSIGGRDADSKSFHEKSYTVLAEECKRHLKCKIEDFSAVHSLIECIGYLSFNANVKEIIVQDHVCVKHLMSQYAFKSTTAYVYVKMLSNLTNSYEEKKSDEQMEKLAKTAKTHVPVKFEKDLLEYAKNRRQIFLDAGLVQQLNRLISLSNVYVDLEVCRIIFRYAETPEYRCEFIKAGILKSLLNFWLCRKEKPELTNITCHTLAKLLISANPNIAYNESFACDVVKPLELNLFTEKEPLQQFEGLLALTNLSSVSNVVRLVIFNKCDFLNIETFIYSENENLRRASVECLCNLVMEETFHRYFSAENDRVKLILLYCLGNTNEEHSIDEKLVLAASGLLATISYNSTVCKKIPTLFSDENKWIFILMKLLINENLDIVFRGISIVYNLFVNLSENPSRELAKYVSEIVSKLKKIKTNTNVSKNIIDLVNSISDIIEKKV